MCFYFCVCAFILLQAMLSNTNEMNGRMNDECLHRAVNIHLTLLPWRFFIMHGCLLRQLAAKAPDELDMIHWQSSCTAHTALCCRQLSRRGMGDHLKPICLRSCMVLMLGCGTHSAAAAPLRDKRPLLLLRSLYLLALSAGLYAHDNHKYWAYGLRKK